MTKNTQKPELSSERLSELEKVRRVIAIKQKSLNALMVELAELKQAERELMPLSRALEQSSSEGTGKDKLTPSEPLFEATRIYSKVSGAEVDKR